MPTQDNFGIWGSLGTVIPVYDHWSQFPLSTEETNPTIRITYFCSDWNQVNSAAWVRVVYKAGGNRVSERATKVYPRNEPLLIQFPVNSDFLLRGITFRYFETKKQLNWDRFVGFVPDIEWSMQIEELWG